MPKIPFCGQAYADRTLNANAQECINLYPMKSPTADQPDRIVMYPTPGYGLAFPLPTFVGTGAGEIRGALVIGDTLYVVSGSQLVSLNNGSIRVVDGAVTASATVSSRGILRTSTGRVSMETNTVEIAISDGQYGYTFNLTSLSFNVISGGGWPTSGGVTNFAYQDGYMLGAVNNSKRIIQSDLLAAGTYGGQAFADVTSFADKIVAVFSDQLQLYVFGGRLTEVRNNAASVPFAFQKVQGVLIQAGCVAQATVVKVAGTLIWLASDMAGKAYIGALEGYQTKVLSTAPINEAIERYAVISDAYAYTYREADNQFYAIVFPSEGVTWAVELKTGFWHQREGDTPTVCANWLGFNVVGDKLGNLHVMSQDIETGSDGKGIRRVRSCQHFNEDNRLLFLNEMEIAIEAGTTRNISAPPLATLEVSRDGGHTWRNVGVREFGRQGEYRRRLVWSRLGYGRNLAFRLTITDTVRSFILGAWAKVTAGNK